MNINDDSIEDLSLNQAVTPDNVSQNVSSDNEVLTTDDTIINNEVTPQVDNSTSLGNNEYGEILSEINKEYPNSYGCKKKVAIIILSILLFLDIVALVIYLIGIDKVFSFIK